MAENGKILYLDPNAAQNVPAEAEAPAAVPSTDDEALSELMQILIETSADPVLKLSNYLVSEDPTYLPEGTPARAIARHYGRDKLLEALIRSYLGNNPKDTQDRQS